MESIKDGVIKYCIQQKGTDSYENAVTIETGDPIDFIASTALSIKALSKRLGLPEELLFEMFFDLLKDENIINKVLERQRSVEDDDIIF